MIMKLEYILSHSVVISMMVINGESLDEISIAGHLKSSTLRDLVSLCPTSYILVLGLYSSETISSTRCNLLIMTDYSRIQTVTLCCVLIISSQTVYIILYIIVWC